MVWHLDNLRSTSVSSNVLPWEFRPEVEIPAAVRANKGARDLWITNPKTKHHVYSFVGGRYDSQRVTGFRKDSGNPPAKVSGLVVDYDCPVTPEQAREGFARVSRPPNWWEVSLSGHGRGIWVFERPLLVPGHKFCAGLLPFLAGKLRAELVAPGVDTRALEAPERYYTNSGEFLPQIAEAPVPAELLLGWLVEFSGKFAFKGEGFGCEMPIDKAAEMLAAKYPRFGEWPGEFALGSQGPSFWVSGSTSPRSAIVRETGIQTFAAHAEHGFYSWEELLGEAAVAEFKSVQIGASVADIFFDGKSYFRKIAMGAYKPFAKEDISADLRVHRGLSNRPDKTGVSQIDKALAWVREHHYVVGAAPFTFQPSGLLQQQGEPVLNTSVRRVLEPAEQGGAWGDNFPFISSFLNVFFTSEEQLEVFKAWLAVAYQSARRLRPQNGQNLFIAGGPSVGKTLLARRIISPLFGGFAEAGDYLLGNDNFGSELFDAYIWCVDDSTSATSRASHRKFSEIVKRMAANTTFRYHAKFRVPLLVDWRGRVVVTLNDDEESIRMIPDLSISLLDKLMLLRARPSLQGTGFSFPNTERLECLLEQELPALAKYLADYRIPDRLLDPNNSRYVLRPHHEESLLSSARHSSTTAAFSEVLDDWRRTYFKNNPNEPFWEGSAFQFHKMLHEDPTAVPALRAFSHETIGRQFSALKSRGDRSVSCEERNQLRVWKITRPDSPEPETKSAPAEGVENVPGSQFTR